MKQYHVNAKGEAGACSATKGKCPFGGEANHFTSAEAARAAYENDQEAVLAGAVTSLRKVRPVAPPKSMSMFHKQLESVPTIEDSKILAAPTLSEGYMGGRAYLGAERAKETEYVSQAKAAEGLRNLVKRAKAMGELPQWLDISVKKNSGSMVNSISLTAGYKPEGGRKVRAIPHEWLYEPQDKTDFRREQTHEEVKKLEKYLATLSRSYESSDINGMVDYYNSSAGGHFEWRHAWHDRD